MISGVRRIWVESDVALRRRIVLVIGGIGLYTLAIWAVVLVASARYGILLGLAPVAYGFGLRHTVNPDHIAAIDNTTRKLMRDGQKPVGVGFFFSLGHSTIVFLLSVLIAISAAFVRHSLPQIQSIGGVIGTSISGIFLVLIAIINVVIFIDIYKSWRRVMRGGPVDEQALEGSLANSGLLARILRPVLWDGDQKLAHVSHRSTLWASVSILPVRWGFSECPRRPARAACPYG